ncbi:MAG: universal stress protein [Chitinophagales bacterium]
MKKIIAAFDGLKYSRSALDYAIFLSRYCNFHLVGIFLEDFTYNSYKIYDSIRKEDKRLNAKAKILEKRDASARAACVSDFEAACQTAGLEFSIHRDRNIATDDLVHETVFADLLIVNSSETLTHDAEKLPTRFIRDLLSDAHAPVLVVPRQFKPPEKLVLLYDGEPSSVHAIKMLSYTLSGLETMPVEIISVRAARDSSHIPENKLMKEFMKRHFPNASNTVIKGSATSDLPGYLAKQEKNCLVTLGAYGRGALSRWFRESMADIIMKDLKLPLFIAHSK